MTIARPLISTPITAEILRGALELEQTADGLVPHRLPAWARAQSADPQLAMAEAQPAAVRFVFSSAASVIELKVRATRRAYRGMPQRPPGVYDLRIDGRLFAQASVEGGNTIHIDMAAWSSTFEAGPAGTLRFAGLGEAMKHVEIWLPHNETTELIALGTDAVVVPIAENGQKLWLHHGSSISHGSNAATPTETWPVVAASAMGVELLNLGFGGGAMLDPFTARTMRDVQADLISVKIGINLVNADLMRLRAFGPAVHGFLDTIREGHPTTPLLVVSPIFCAIHEDVPGPSLPDFGTGDLQFRAAGEPAEIAGGKLTLTVIRKALADIVRQRAVTDPNIQYLDGLQLYGEIDHADLPLPDRLHPDAATHGLIGKRFADQAFARAE